MNAFRKSLNVGLDSLRRVNEQIDYAAASFVVDAIVQCPGRRYFTGIGKSGLAADRMASSLCSIGLASHSVHASEWAHGELGALQAGDLIMAVSHSGSTAEVVWLIDRLEERQQLNRGSHWMSSIVSRKHAADSPVEHAEGSSHKSKTGICVVALTGNASSVMAQKSSLSLTYALSPSAEALDLLPTSSLLAVHHIFNALLCECVERVQLTASDVLRNHPGGGVGIAAIHAMSTTPNRCQTSEFKAT